MSTLVKIIDTDTTSVLGTIPVIQSGCIAQPHPNQQLSLLLRAQASRCSGYRGGVRHQNTPTPCNGAMQCHPAAVLLWTNIDGYIIPHSLRTQQRLVLHIVVVPGRTPQSAKNADHTLTLWLGQAARPETLMRPCMGG